MINICLFNFLNISYDLRLILLSESSNLPLISHCSDAFTPRLCGQFSFELCFGASYHGIFSWIICWSYESFSFRRFTLDVTCLVLIYCFWSSLFFACTNSKACLIWFGWLRNSRLILKIIRWLTFSFLWLLIRSIEHAHSLIEWCNSWVCNQFGTWLLGCSWVFR